MLAFIKTNNSYSFISEETGKSYLVDSGHHNYTEIENIIKDNGGITEEELESLYTLEEAVTQWSSPTANTISVVSGEVLYKGKPLHNSVTQRILELVKENVNPLYMCNFLARLMENVSFNVRAQLYPFLEKEGIPITPDGHFLAYKYVRPDYKDLHSNTIDNSVGQSPRMDRSEVDDNPNNPCSAGLHVGSYNYVKEKSKIVIVKVDPADVVSVPTDHNCDKVRTCGYTVIADFVDKLPNTAVDNDNESDSDDDDDWDDDDYGDLSDYDDYES